MSIVLAWSLIAILAIVGVWDVYVLFVRPDLETVSAVISEWSHIFPILPMVAGILLGHLFWPVRKIK